ncbi:hypothetical protein [Sphingopyxis sp.]|jgi:hypothetical protein|uniref:hypothetical protein n=1 Tax=Sphingopyxis sp. TaxID=1908224 RepID=UPI002E01FE4A|nr:hypothetical protein [Sphingopyxis sp.]
MAGCSGSLRERPTARESNQAPELGKLPRPDGNGEREYQPIERQRRTASRNVNPNAVVNAADDGMKLSGAGDRQ